MKVDFNYKDSLSGIVADVLRMEQLTETEQATALKEIGKTIKKAVREELPKSDETHRHMRDDIKVKVQGRKTGVSGVTVYGGRDTAYKWHMLDDGTRNPNGTVHTKATHFTQKALASATPQIEREIDALVRKVTQG